MRWNSILLQQQIEELFSTSRPNIIKHINNIYAEEELRILNNLVYGNFDFAEIQAIRHNLMHMEDYIRKLDIILDSTGEKLLVVAWTVSHTKAIEKTKDEYKKYQVKTISTVVKEYLETLKVISNKINDKVK